MHLKTGLLAVTAALTAVTAQTTCHSYVIITIRGTYEVQGPSIAFTSMINDTFAAIPGGIQYYAVYPAAANQTAYLGADDVTRYIDAGLQDCPDQKYAILGYSQGASATMLTLMNITDPSLAAYKAIKAVLVVGNPYHVPNAAINVDEDGGDRTRSYAGSAYNTAMANTSGIPEIYYNNGELIDICHTEDIVCAPKYPNASFAPGHLKYGDPDVQALGAKFLIDRLGGNGTATATSTSSSTASSTASATPPAYTGSASALSASITVALAGLLTALYLW